MKAVLLYCIFLVTRGYQSVSFYINKMIFIACNKVYLIWDFSISLGSLLDFLTHHMSIKHDMAVCLVSFYYNLSFFLSWAFPLTSPSLIQIIEWQWDNYLLLIEHSSQKPGNHACKLKWYQHASQGSWYCLPKYDFSYFGILDLPVPIAIQTRFFFAGTLVYQSEKR